MGERPHQPDHQTFAGLRAGDPPDRRHPGQR